MVQAAYLGAVVERAGPADPGTVLGVERPGRPVDEGAAGVAE